MTHRLVGDTLPEGCRRHTQLQKQPLAEISLWEFDGPPRQILDMVGQRVPSCAAERLVSWSCGRLELKGFKLGLRKSTSCTTFALKSCEISSWGCGSVLHALLMNVVKPAPQKFGDGARESCPAKMALKCVRWKKPGLQVSAPCFHHMGCGTSVIGQTC